MNAAAPAHADFDALDDDDAPNAQSSTALPPPGPVLSPTDPRYGRPAGAPVYSDRGAPMPTGPILSPDDPRYGRPAGAPVYSDRGAPMPTGPVLSPDDPRYGRPAGPPAVIYADRPARFAAAGLFGSRRQPHSRRRHRLSERRPRWPAPAGGDRRAPAPARSRNRSNPPSAPTAGRCSLPRCRRKSSRKLRPAQLPPQPAPPGSRLSPTKEPAGTIVVDTSNTHLYYVLGGGRAIRYGVRVGRDGFTWTGVQKISRKAEWPDWHPPTEMIERQPYLPRFMAGGPGNPLGARAMYLGSTIYRIHGTNQPSTIGKFVSSGCIGMLNEDVSDLFERAKVGTRVVVLPGGPPPGTATASAAPPPGGPAAPQAPAQAQLAPVPGAQPTVVPPLPAPVTVR